MSHVNWNSRVQRPQWIGDAEALARFVRWYGTGFENDVALQVRRSCDAKRTRRMAERKL